MKVEHGRFNEAPIQAGASQRSGGIIAAADKTPESTERRAVTPQL